MVLAASCVLFILTAILFFYLNISRNTKSYPSDVKQLYEQSKSTEIEDIEKDLDDTQLEDLDKELEDIEKELENAL